MALLVLAIGAKYDTFIHALMCIAIKFRLPPRRESMPSRRAP
ncbi:hypothetical protein BURPS406E_P0385 [Burkholderia pseudomallei 406e]|nr:hypothetical protein BURPS406E_P0385 [Burkholderia pseudomallei 406e]EDU10516.1 hypothetical protein BURPS1655_C0636 [Burkholderia pseudomallei 1655]KGD38787.1 hypothetical protein DP44_2763 [Burkholderia pseudomallei]